MRGDGVQVRVQLRRLGAEVVVHAAEFAVVQRAHERRADIVDQPHQGEGLGDHPVEVQLLVLQRKRPLDLFVRGRTEEAATVLRAVQRAGEPVLVQSHPVRVDAPDDVPGVVELFAQAARPRPAYGPDGARSGRPSARWDVSHRTPRRVPGRSRSSPRGSARRDGTIRPAAAGPGPAPPPRARRNSRRARRRSGTGRSCGTASTRSRMRFSGNAVRALAHFRVTAS